MNEVVEIFNKLSELKGRTNALTQSDKYYIKSVYYAVIQKELKKTCTNCYSDALFEILLKLKKHNIMEKKKSSYLLKNGVILHCAKFSDVVSNDNITDELAEKFLKDNPKRINFFASFPDDWKKKIELIEVEVEKETETETNGNIEELQKQLSEETAKNKELQKQLDGANIEINDLKAEIDLLKSELPVPEEIVPEQPANVETPEKKNEGDQQNQLPTE